MGDGPQWPHEVLGTQNRTRDAEKVEHKGQPNLVIGRNDKKRLCRQVQTGGGGF